MQFVKLFLFCSGQALNQKYLIFDLRDVKTGLLQHIVKSQDLVTVLVDVSEFCRSFLLEFTYFQLLANLILMQSGLWIYGFWDSKLFNIANMAQLLTENMTSDPYCDPFYLYFLSVTCLCHSSRQMQTCVHMTPLLQPRLKHCQS